MRISQAPLYTSASELRDRTRDLVDELVKQDHASPKPTRSSSSIDRRNRGYPELTSSTKHDTKTKNQAYLEDNTAFVYPHANAQLVTDIQPGDFVEARKSNATHVGVILPLPEDREVSGAGQGTTLLMVLATGQLEQIRATDITFQLPRFVDANMAADAAPLKWDYVLATASHTKSALAPEDNLELSESIVEEEPVDLQRFSVRATICRKIREMQRHMDRQIRRIFPAFRTLFLQDPALNLTGYAPAEQRTRQCAADVLQSGVLSTGTAASLIEQFLTRKKEKLMIRTSMLFATHTLLMSHPIQFLADAISHRRSQLFTYRPRHDQRILERVSAWVHALTSEKPSELGQKAKAILDGFCNRARHVMAWHDNRPTKLGLAPQPDVRVPGMDGTGELVWTETDKVLLEFLKISLGNRRELQDNLTGSIAMAIIKRVGINVRLHPLAYDANTKMPQPSGDKILSQGTSSLTQLQTDVTQAGMDLQHSQIFNFLIRIGVLAPWENPNALDTQLKNMRDVHGMDQHEWDLFAEQAPRHSFGDMPVYVIDSATSHELDDGISLEATDDPARYWVHVHIADPSAWISPDHPLAKIAQHKFSSIYLPECMLPMLPTSVTAQGMSLSDSRGSMNVLTFSALVDAESGRVSSYDVRRGTVSNVKILNYEQVNNLFLNSDNVAAHGILDETSQQNLRRLAELASKLNRRRVLVGRALNATDASSDVSIEPTSLEFLAGKTLDHPRFYTGFPTIRVQFADYENVERRGTYDRTPGGVTSESMVSEMMILAGRVAASFGAENNISLPYRIQPEPAESELAVINELKHPETGTMAMSKLISRDIFLPTGHSSIKPGIHFALGIRPIAKNNTDSDALYRGGYVRVTSPLRRYADLVCHWQLKAVLDGQKPPFDSDAMGHMLNRFDQMDNWVRQLERASVRFWIWTYVDQLLKKRNRLEAEGQDDYAQFFTKSERELLNPIPAFQGIMDVRFNSETLESNIRVSLLHFGGLPVDCTWPTGAPPPKRDQIKNVKIQKTMSAGIKRTIVCSPV